MRILFLSSSQEAARDGVGDYVRALAGACLRRGHTCAVIALHDRYAPKLLELTETLADGKLPLLRIASTLPWPAKLEPARGFISAFKPDWISLQVVPFGLDNRGMLSRPADVLRKLTSGLKLHIMFHELWIGEAPPALLRHRLIGRIQRHGIKKMLALLRPQVVTTTNPFYRAILKRAEIQSALLPLFGHIPAEPLLPKLGLPDKLAQALIEPDQEGSRPWWIGIFFGALHPEWKAKPLLPILLRVAQKANKRVCLVLVGHAGALGESLWADLQRSYSPGISFVKLGEQSTGTISALLQISDFGVTTTPWQLVGKSGTVAAMLDHGLPVLVPRDDVDPGNLPIEPAPIDPLLHHCDESLEAKLAGGLPKRPTHARLDEIADQFLRLLA